MQSPAVGQHPLDERLAQAQVRAAAPLPGNVQLTPGSTVVLTREAILLTGWSPATRAYGVVLQLPLRSVRDVGVNPLRVRPRLTITSADGTPVGLYGKANELTQFAEAYRRLVDPDAAPVLGNPLSRFIARVGTARLLIITSSLALLAAMVTAGVLFPRVIERFEETGFLSEGPRAPQDLREGECFNNPADTPDEGVADIALVDVVSCREPHDNEVYALNDYPGATAQYPGDATVQNVAGEECSSAFPSGLGAPGDHYDIFVFFPSPSSWAAGDRQIVCAAYNLTGKLHDPLSALT